MGRRSLPKGRFSLRRGMRFEPLEAAIIAASFLVFALGLLVSLSEMRAIAHLTEHGRCVDAQVEAAGSGDPVLAVGLVAFVLMIGKHQWRFPDDTPAKGGPS
ncbi:hypothetical protein ACFY36_05490 [Actinoplanes sp. NPDC000266]